MTWRAAELPAPGSSPSAGPRCHPSAGLGSSHLVSAPSRPRPERNPMSITSRRVLPLAAIVALIALPATANAGDHGSGGPCLRAAGRPPAGHGRTLRRGHGGLADRRLRPTAATACCASRGSTPRPTARPSGPTCTPARASPATAPPPSATTTPTSSPGSPRPRSARTPRCGSTSPSRTARRPRRHPCPSSRFRARARSSSTRWRPTTTPGPAGARLACLPVVW